MAGPLPSAKTRSLQEILFEASCFSGSPRSMYVLKAVAALHVATAEEAIVVVVVVVVGKW